VAALIFIPFAASAEDGGFYLRAFGGVSMLSDTTTSGIAVTTTEFDTGTSLGGAIGWSFATLPLRAELEFVYRSGDATGPLEGDFASTTFFINALYDLTVTGKIQPYVGAGLGYVTEIDWDVDAGAFAGEYASRGDTALQLILGASYALSDQWDLTAEIRRVDAGQQTLMDASGQTLKADYTTTDLTVGIAFQY